MPRLSLLMLTAAVAGTATIGNAVGLAAATDSAGKTRLGVAIDNDISQRDQAANRRNRGLNLREQAVRAAEARLKGDSGPNAASVDGTSPGTAPSTDQYDNLARIYQAMKPAAAAMVLEQLDLDVQKRVVQKMRERSTALILAAMSTKGAARLTMALAERHHSTTAPTVAANPRTLTK